MNKTAPLQQQRAFFESFGFLKLPGLLRPEIDSITSEFEAVFPELGLEHDGTHRTAVFPFIDRRPVLCSLLEHPGLVSAIENLLGPDFNYVGSDGNYYTGETTWHRDSFSPSDSFIKLAIYLDPVTDETGALRVIPGSHTDEALRRWDELDLRNSENLWGLAQRELPGVALTSNPGDVLIFSHRLLHASFGGGRARRMFTLNLSRHAETPQEISDLVAYGDTHCYEFGATQPYLGPMIEQATPSRMARLEQLLTYWPASIERRRARTGRLST